MPTLGGWVKRPLIALAIAGCIESGGLRLPGPYSCCITCLGREGGSAEAEAEAEAGGTTVTLRGRVSS